MRLKPLFDKIIVKYEEQKEEKTASGIIIPAALEKKDKPKEAFVLAVGGGTPSDPMYIKEGDYVLFNKDAGFVYEFEGEKYLFLSQREIIAIV